MILVDTSIWIDHFRTANAALVTLIMNQHIVQHPFVTGEVLVGNPGNRQSLAWALQNLPRIEPVEEDAFHAFLESSRTWGTGLGFVDIHLLAAARAVEGTMIWTKDSRLMNHALEAGLAYTS